MRSCLVKSHYWNIVARIIGDADGRTGEFAFLVGDAWQGQCIGANLLENKKRKRFAEFYLPDLFIEHEAAAPEANNE